MSEEEMKERVRSWIADRRKEMSKRGIVGGHQAMELELLEQALGPRLYTEEEVAARESAAAERAWLAGYFNACGTFIGEGEGDARIAARQSWEIHRDEFAAPGALDKMNAAAAEAMREALIAAIRARVWPPNTSDYIGGFNAGIDAAIREAERAPLPAPGALDRARMKELEG